MPVFVGLLTTELIIPEAASLKDKRQALRSLLTRMPNKLKVAVAEVDHLDCHQRAGIATATVSNTKAHVHSILMAASQFIEAEPRIVVQSETVEIM